MVSWELYWRFWITLLVCSGTPLLCCFLVILILVLFLFLFYFFFCFLDLRRDFSLLDFLYNLEKYVYLGDFCFYCLNNITKMLVWIFIDVFWIICMLSLSIPLIFCFCLALRFSLFQPRFYNNLVFCFQKNVIMWSLTWL